jgi:hypothetical protein
MDRGVSGLILNVPARNLQYREIRHVLGHFLTFGGLALTICPATRAPGLCPFLGLSRSSRSWLPVRIPLCIIIPPRQMFAAIIGVAVYVRAIDRAYYLAHEPQPCVCGFSRSLMKAGGGHVSCPLMWRTESPPDLSSRIMGESGAKECFKSTAKGWRPARVIRSYR